MEQQNFIFIFFFVRQLFVMPADASCKVYINGKQIDKREVLYDEDVIQMSEPAGRKFVVRYAEGNKNRNQRRRALKSSAVAINVKKLKQKRGIKQDATSSDSGERQPTASSVDTITSFSSDADASSSSVDSKQRGKRSSSTPHISGMKRRVTRSSSSSSHRDTNVLIDNTTPKRRGRPPKKRMKPTLSDVLVTAQHMQEKSPSRVESEDGDTPNIETTIDSDEGLIVNLETRRHSTESNASIPIIMNDESVTHISIDQDDDDAEEDNDDISHESSPDLANLGDEESFRSNHNNGNILVMSPDMDQFTLTDAQRPMSPPDFSKLGLSMSQELFRSQRLSRSSLEMLVDNEDLQRRYDEVKNENNRLLEELACTNDILSAREAEISRLKHELEKERFNANTVVSQLEASRVERNTIFKSAEKSIAELRESIATLRKERETLVIQLEKKTSFAEMKSIELDHAEHRINDADEEILELTRKVASLEEKVASSRIEIENLMEENREMTARCADISQRERTKDSLQQRAKPVSYAIRALLKQYKREYEALDDQRRRAEEAQSRLQSKVLEHLKLNDRDGEDESFGHTPDTYPTEGRNNNSDDSNSNKDNNDSSGGIDNTSTTPDGNYFHWVIKKPSLVASSQPNALRWSHYNPQSFDPIQNISTSSRDKPPSLSQPSLNSKTRPPLLSNAENLTVGGNQTRTSLNDQSHVSQAIVRSSTSNNSNNNLPNGTPHAFDRRRLLRGKTKSVTFSDGTSPGQPERNL